MADSPGQSKKTGWRKYFKVTNTGGQLSPLSGTGAQGLPGYGRNTGDNNWAHADMVYRNYASRLPEVYSGHPNRVERYNQYEAMDMDSEINACLDILAEFSTQTDPQTNLPFQIRYNDQPTDNEVRILKQQLQQWVKLNRLEQRIFRIFRNTIKYGDQVFVRDPETFEMYWVDMTKVARVIVNESEGKRPEQYVIRDINPNFQNMTVAAKTTTDYQSNPPSSGYVAPFNYTIPTAGEGGQGFGQSRFTAAMNEAVLDAKHIVHLSLTEGLDFYWPFGQSVLETIFRVFKQKELLEDSVLIYRVARAPERRVFKIDVGNMPSHLAMQFVERVKNEIHQRRIPSRTGGGSNIMDSSYNPMCLDLDTRIPLLDGRTLTLSDIIAEFESGKENWVYSCDPDTGEVVPGVIDWAGVTRQNTETIEITLDNGRTLVCTPDHKIPVFGRGFVEAQDLTVEDSLIAFNTRLEKISTNSNDYQQIWDHATKSWKWTHRMVGEFFRQRQKHQEFTYLDENRGKAKTVIHHKDHDRFNNDPRNLTYMHRQDHILYHAAQKKDFWENMTDEYRADMTGKISSTLRENWKNLSAEARLEKLWPIRAAQAKAAWLRKNDPVFAAKYNKNASVRRKKQIADNPSIRAQLIQNLESRVKIKNQSVNLTFDMLQIVADLVKTRSKNKEQILELCDQHPRLLTLVKQANPRLTGKNLHCKIDFNKFGYSKMDRLLEKFGYKNWKQFVREIDNFNHRVVSIRKVSNRDTGTITVDGRARWHDHHTFAVDCGIFVKNSINEDYFFPQGEGGRGSSVEVLPGGSNLGEIDDLKYFNNKMCRGLRVPSSYLPTGPDDSDRPLSDGRVGTALIQEYRFNQYCERLQRLVIEKLDDEFKMFMRWRGFNIDAGLFSISFNPPQNFASYREAELDTTRVNTFTTLDAVPYLSKRFLLKRYLGLSDDEITKNEDLWQEERTEAKAAQPTGQDLRSVGVSPAGIESDLAMGAEMADLGAPGDLGVAGAVPGAAPGQQPAAGAATPAMGAPPAAGAAPTV
jgi:hypothetical protein